MAGRAVSVVASLAVTALVTRRAAVGDAASYFLAASMIAVAGAVAHRSVSHTVIRIAAQSLANGSPGRARGGIAAALRFTFGAAVLAAVIATAALPLEMPARLTIATSIVLFTVQLVASEALRGLHASFAATLTGSVIAPLVAVAGVALAEATLAPILLAVAISHGAAACAALLLLGRRTRKLGPAIRVPLTAFTSAALPIWVSGIGLSLFAHVDLWIAAGFLPATTVATYGVASRLSALLALPLIVVNSAIAPTIADLFARGQTAQLQLVLRATAAVAALPGIGVVIVFAMFGRTIVESAFGPAYGVGAVLVVLLGLGQIVNVLTGSCGVTLLMTGHERLLMRVTAVMLPATALAGVVAAQAWGATGIAAAFGAGIAATNVILAATVFRATGLRTYASLGALSAFIGHRRGAA